jgi:nicotinate-nucleotide--dimethylbenzimidazole phosphoribosyltransferase
LSHCVKKIKLFKKKDVFKLNFREALLSIGELDREAISETKKNLDNLTKPLGSLGKLEDILQKISGIQQSSSPDISKKAVIIMCADNGVYEEGISSCPKEVTSSVTRNFTRGITGINVFANLTKADLFVVDIGVDDNLEGHEGIFHNKIRRGTNNIAKGPAMSREEAITSIEIGINMVSKLKKEGYNLLGTGEMGIGNTTTSSAVAAAFIGCSPEEVVGYGSGLTKEGFSNKIEIVKRAISLNKPVKEDPIDVLAKVGGFDIAGLAGCFIGAAAFRIPIIIDGFISAVAALTAIRIEPKVRNFVFPSHSSAEPGCSQVLKELDFEALLTLNMRLGEGTGAALAFMLFEAAMEAYLKMGTFQDAIIEKYVPLE